MTADTFNAEEERQERERVDNKKLLTRETAKNMLMEVSNIVVAVKCLGSEKTSREVS